MTLTVTKTGNGPGTITSLQTGIDCGATCSGIYDWGTSVTLAATPATGSIFTGWSGACTGTETTCTVTMDQLQAVSADFTPMQAAPDRRQNRQGTGTITAFRPGSIAAPAVAAATTGARSHPDRDAVCGFPVQRLDRGLHRHRDHLHGHDGSGAERHGRLCPGLQDAQLATLGSGTGTVTSSPAGIDCGTVCRADFAPNTVSHPDRQPRHRLDVRRLVRRLHRHRCHLHGHPGPGPVRQCHVLGAGRSRLTSTMPTAT